MRWTVLVLLAIVAGLAALAAARGVLGAGVRSSGVQALKFLPVLGAAFLIMGFMEVLLPEDLVQRWLSDASGWRGMAVAWLGGMLTPAGSLTGMPLAAGLLRAGVGAGILVTYLTSLATLSLLRLPLEIGFYGWRLTALRVLASVALPLVAGLTTRWLAAWFTRVAG